MRASKALHQPWSDAARWVGFQTGAYADLRVSGAVRKVPRSGPWEKTEPHRSWSTRRHGQRRRPQRSRAGDSIKRYPGQNRCRSADSHSSRRCGGHLTASDRGWHATTGFGGEAATGLPVYAAPGHETGWNLCPYAPERGCHKRRTRDEEGSLNPRARECGQGCRLWRHCRCRWRVGRGSGRTRLRLRRAGPTRDGPNPSYRGLRGLAQRRKPQLRCRAVGN
jgi:hypothetical protein